MRAQEQKVYLANVLYAPPFIPLPFLPFAALSVGALGFAASFLGATAFSLFDQLYDCRTFVRIRRHSQDVLEMQGIRSWFSALLNESDWEMGTGNGF
jgi:hypothetical protein